MTGILNLPVPTALAFFACPFLPTLSLYEANALAKRLTLLRLSPQNKYGN